MADAVEEKILRDLCTVESFVCELCHQIYKNLG